MITPDQIRNSAKDDLHEGEVRDAARYRWLRSYRGTSIDEVYMHGGNEELDAAIDAALSDRLEV